MNEIEKKLKTPFPAQDIKWRAGATNQDKTSALAVAYIDARLVMDRLDEAVGGENWQDEYGIKETEKGTAVVCRLGIVYGNGFTVWKSDAAGLSNFEAIKGGMSDAFKRAAVKHGIGRYLYGLPGQWVECEQKGKTVVLKTTPPLPDWALPEGKKKTADKINEELGYEPKAKAGRPLSPESLRSMLARKAKNEYSTRQGTPKQRKFLAILLSACLEDENARHAVTKYLTGNASTDDVSGSLVSSMLDWLNPDDKYNPDEMARREANRVYTEALKEQGQEELFEGVD